MKTQDPIAKLVALSSEDRAWVVAALSPPARAELLRLTRGELTAGERDGRSAEGSVDEGSAVSGHDSTPVSMLIEQLSRVPMSTLIEILAGEPIWLTAALLRVTDWPWRTQLLQRLPHVALYLCPTVEPAGVALTEALVRSLLQLILDKTACMPVPVAAGKFEMLVQKVAARRVAAWRSI